jgi:hypothetical protein
MLQSLVSASAFIWGCVDTVRGVASGSNGARNVDFIDTTSATANALRRAMIHLRQAIPPDLDISDTHEKYFVSLREVFENESGDLETMVSADLPAELRAKYADAVNGMRSALLQQRAPPLLQTWPILASPVRGHAHIRLKRCIRLRACKCFSMVCIVILRC